MSLEEEDIEIEDLIAEIEEIDTEKDQTHGQGKDWKDEAACGASEEDGFETDGKAFSYNALNENMVLESADEEVDEEIVVEREEDGDDEFKTEMKRQFQDVLDDLNVEEWEDDDFWDVKPMSSPRQKATESEGRGE